MTKPPGTPSIPTSPNRAGTAPVAATFDVAGMFALRARWAVGPGPIVLDPDAELHQAAQFVQPRGGAQLQGSVGAASDVMATAWELDAERPYLLMLARRLVLNPQDAHDLVQDAIVRALPALGAVTAGSHLRAWLLTILRHMHIDQLRRVAREPQTIPIDRVHEPPATEAAADDPTDGMSAEDIHAALRMVPKSFRQVLVLHELEGRSYREIAHMLDLPLSTVGTRLSRARVKLRRVLVTRQAIKASSEHQRQRGCVMSTPPARRPAPVSLVRRIRPAADRPS